MNFLEIAGVLVGLFYLYLEYKASVWLWLAGIIMPAIYIFVYYDAGLYADLAISLYYIIASVYGWVVWYIGRKKRSEEVGTGEAPVHESGISRMPGRGWIGIGVLTLVLTLLIGYLLLRFTDSTVPWADGFTTALSIIAMWMLARKYTQQWLVWILADVGCAVLYCYKELWFTGALYLLYAIIAWFGYQKWNRIVDSSQ